MWFKLLEQGGAAKKNCKLWDTNRYSALSTCSDLRKEYFCFELCMLINHKEGKYFADITFPQYF